MGAVVSKVKVLSIAVRQVLEISASYERLQKRIQEDPGLPVPNPTRSFWHDVLSPIARHVPETLPVYVDVVVIGSGITGASTARTLLREGPDDLKVLMIEARDACSGATGRCVCMNVLPSVYVCLYNDITLFFIEMEDTLSRHYIMITCFLRRGWVQNKLQSLSAFA